MSKRRRKKVNDKRNKKLNIKAGKKISAIEKVIFILTLILVFYPPYFRGLYFESEQFFAEIFAFILFIAFWVLRLLKKEGRFIETPLEYAAFGFVVVYAVSMVSAVALRPALSEWLKYLMFFSVFYMVSEFARDAKKRERIFLAVIASAAGVALLGIDGAAGSHISEFINKIFNFLGVRHDISNGLFIGGRLHSTIQYPNAAAAYFMTVFFILLYFTLKNNSIIQRIILSGAGFLLAQAFIMTKSRGAFLVFGVSVLVYIAFLPGGKRIEGLFNTIALMGPAVLAYSKLSQYIREESSIKVLLTLIAGAAVSAVASFALHFLARMVTGKLLRVKWKVYAGIAAALIVLLIVSTAVLSSFARPISLSRGENEKDGSKSRSASVALDPGETYMLAADIDAKNTAEKPYALRISVYSKNKSQIMFDGSTGLINEAVKATDGLEPLSYEFTVPEDGKLVYINFLNYYGGTGADVKNVRILNENNRVIKNVVFEYKYLPGEIINRLKHPFKSDSFYSRMTFYKDGLKIVGDNWLTGAGGGAWPLVYSAYQSFSYWSKQTHNFWLQLGIETGIPGLLLLVYLVFILVFMFVKTRKMPDNDRILVLSVLASVFSLLAHSFFDFDLSLGSISLLFFVLLAVLNAHYFYGINSERAKGGIAKLLNTKGINVPPLLFILCIALTLIPVFRFKGAEIYSREAWVLFNEKNERYEGSDLMKKAISMDNIKPHYKIDYCNMLINRSHMKEEIAEAVGIMDEAVIQSFNDIDLLPRATQFYFSTGHLDKGLDAIKRVAELKPLWEGAWQQKITAHYEIGKYYFSKNKSKEGLAFFNKALELVEEAKEANIKGLNPFTFKQNTLDALQSMQYVVDNGDRGITINIDNILFYYIGSLDVNGNGIPDQLDRTGKSGNVEVGDDGNKLLVSASDGKTGYFNFSHMNPEAGNKYNLDIEFSNIEDLKTFGYYIPGVTAKPVYPELSGNLSIEFEVPESYNRKTTFLRLYINGRCEIDSMLVEKAED